MKYIILLGMLLVVVSLVVVATPVYATNEASYKWGHEGGKQEWFSCDSGGDCHNAIWNCY